MFYVGFRASILSDEPTEEKFNTIQEALNDLIQQIAAFETHFKTAKTENHPFFGELDYEY